MWFIQRKQIWSVLVVLLVLCTTGRAQAELVLPNLRALRTPDPWIVLEGDVRLNVYASQPARQRETAHWTLRVYAQLPPGDRLIGVTTEGAEVRQNRRDPMAFKVKVVTSAACRLTEQRLLLTATLQIAHGKKSRSVALPLDYLCLLGDITSEQTAETFADIASRYLYDPTIEAALVSAPPGTLADELARVATWYGPNDARFLLEPNAIVLGLPRGTAYILSPTETIRFGGDCEDYAILVGGYLVRRGYPVEMLFRPGHVWLRVTDPSNGEQHEIQAIKGWSASGWAVIKPI